MPILVDFILPRLDASPHHVGGPYVLKWRIFATFEINLILIDAHFISLHLKFKKGCHLLFVKVYLGFQFLNYVLKVNGVFERFG